MPPSLRSLNVWRYSEEELVLLAGCLFEAAAILTPFKISHATLSSFLQALRATYQPNPYHNFYHATQVLHGCWLIARGGIGTERRPLEHLDILALLIAAIGHDADHPGEISAME